MNRIDLTLIKRLVQELEASLAEAELLKADQVEYTVALGKALGLASSISQEGIYLAGDVARLTKDSQKSAFKSADSLWDLFGAPKKTKGES